MARFAAQARHMQRQRKTSCEASLRRLSPRNARLLVEEELAEIKTDETALGPSLAASCTKR